MTNNKKVLALSGPTASGKTAAAIEIARQNNAQIVNFDSLCFYNELTIGTAKPSELEQRQAPHHLINISTIERPINAADYVRLALPLCEELLDQGHPVILVGGSGFYLRALVIGMYEAATPSSDILTKSEMLYKERGIEPFIEELRRVDPESMQTLHPNDHYRIRRALEHFWSTGTKFSNMRAPIEPVWKKKGWSFKHAHLDLPKDQHWNIIQDRTKKMVSNGLIEEVQAIMALGLDLDSRPLRSIGYKQTIDYIQSSSTDLEALEEAINIATRQLAKAQRTWFKKIEKDVFHPIAHREQLLSYAKEFFREDR